MTEARIDAPFGPVTLSSPVGAVGPIGPAHPELPEGLSVDACIVGEIEIAFGAGEVIELVFAAELERGVRCTTDDGEFFAAWLVETKGVAGCFGFRDVDWLQHKHDVEMVSFANSKAGTTLRLRSPRTQVVRIPFGAAWTTGPDMDAGTTAAALAVDRALPT